MVSVLSCCGVRYSIELIQMCRKLNKQKFLIVFGVVNLIFLLFLYCRSNDNRGSNKVRIVSFVIPKKDPNDVFNVWRHIGDPKLRHQIYSAYFDPRSELTNDETAYGSVRVFAILPLNLLGQMFCVFTLKNESTIRTYRVKAIEALPIHEHFSEPFSAYTIMCPVTAQSNGIAYLPHSVGLSYADNPRSLQLPSMIPISYPLETIQKPRKKFLAACVGPLENNYNQVLRLVEFIEIYRLMGVEKFYFYNYNTTESILKILNFYREKNLTEIFNWTLTGYIFEEELRYFGILAEFNECVYRATFIDEFEYVAVIDVDEILMPFYSTFAEILNKYDDERTSSFGFRHVIFSPNISLINNFYVPPNIQNRFLRTQVETYRSRTPLPYETRSKYIVKGRTAIEMGNHKVWRSIKGYGHKTILTKDGLLFHYRSKFFESYLNDGFVSDTTALKFGSLIWDTVENVCKINFPDGICPIK